MIFSNIFDNNLNIRFNPIRHLNLMNDIYRINSFLQFFKFNLVLGGSDEISIFCFFVDINIC